ncbi:HIT family protein [Lactiplantibacillus dongliensis]|uniref:HIT family protein n=1 Tax=Lactiplantibacillus dongliensis TaxID=2559919 RepID=A0ABW1R7Q0_9LACO|nr:HIT family protein [Lactiplantibacillus dongliensis]
MTACVFCQPANQHYVVENDVAGMLYDTHPVTPGHALIVTKQHTATFFKTSLEVQVGMLALLPKVKAIIDANYHPAGYNLDVNIGRAGGQAIMHTHLHVIPRYRHDQLSTNQPIQRQLPAGLPG